MGAAQWRGRWYDDQVHQGGAVFFILWSASRVTLAREAYDVFRGCLNEALLVQLQSEWTNDETIPNMAQKVRDKG